VNLKGRALALPFLCGSTQNYAYSAYGECLSGKDAVNAFRFVGRYGGMQDDETGLTYFWNRWYDSKAGRWMSEDPVRQGGGNNLYEYANNLPTSAIDPMGLISTDEYQINPIDNLDYLVTSHFGITMVIVRPVPFGLKLTDCRGNAIGNSLITEDVELDSASGFNFKIYPTFGKNVTSETTSSDGIFHDSWGFQLIGSSDFSIAIKQTYHATINGATWSGTHVPSFTQSTFNPQFPVYLHEGQ